jgi:hypothetical protein
LKKGIYRSAQTEFWGDGGGLRLKFMLEAV